ncbi:MAG: ribonuclease HII [Candidatus Aminicenantes bacterium]|nr:ribonuclease HII [Candidatus Aminicenantes bacterium]
MCDYKIERKLLKQEYRYICGVDEVGRGALFGPVVSGAVILNPGILNFKIKDSKKLCASKRLELAEDIYQHSLAYSVGWCWNDEIDCSNILEATKKSMRRAVNKLQINPDYVLVDGLAPDFLNIKGEGIIKGDSKSLSIAAASIIAKVFRDQLLIDFSKYYPEYDFEKNKGYPTQKHLNMVTLKGITEFHRKSFGWKNGKGK